MERRLYYKFYILEQVYKLQRWDPSGNNGCWYINLYLEGEWIMWNWGEIYEQTKRAKCKLDRRQISWITYSFQSFSSCLGNDDSVSTSSIGTQLHSAIQGNYYKYFSSPISSSNNHTSWYKPHLWMHVYLYFYIFLSISDQTILISQQRIIFTKFNIARRYNESNSTPTKFSA